MKRFLALLLMLTLVFVGCASGANGDSDSGQDGETAYKDRIVYAQQKDITSLDPHIGREATAIQTTINIFSTLLTYDENLDPVADVAKAWEQTADTVWEFTLRDDITFHDGSQLTSADVKFSLDRAIESPKTNYLVNFIEKVEVLDEYKVAVHTHQPYAAILRNLSHPAIAIVPKAYVEADPEILKTQPMGSGPYKFVEWEMGEYCKLEAYEGYFKGEAPTKYLTMKIVPEGAQRVIGLETGELDIAYDLMPNDRDKVSENPELKLNDSPSLWIYYLSFNMNKEPLDNQKVRQAIRYGIDEQAIVESVFYGAAQVANSVIPTTAFGYSEDSKSYPHDVEKAKSLLAEAGYADGFEISMLVREDQIRVEMAQIIQSELKEIGIDVKIDVVASTVEKELVNGGDYDFSVMRWSTPPADADYTYYPLYHSAQQGAPGNRSFLSNPEVDKLVMDGKYTSDQAQREEIYYELDALVTEISNLGPLCSDQILIGMSSKIDGFFAHGAGYHKLYGVTLEK